MFLSRVEDECGDIPMVLVQNKIDLLEQATILNEEAEALARDMKLRLYRTSVLENLNVDQVFSYLCGLYLAELRAADDEWVQPEKSIANAEFGVSSS
ncbi:unnamed protein product [Cyprideis torosa]|uniref:Uncharacterized protein n=1 Tax=Cyprideis torosa TaxID=163714 RepID=A0A7R8WCT9_9CRUS|nr:unnamed protein product [Cyprideis torosa]CAG0891249.1 unnamed protein product [Cyprideis torosa]